MATFSPLNWNAGIDPALATTFSQALGGSNNAGFGLGSIGGSSTGALANLTPGTGVQAPGSLFSSLFGDGGLFSRESLFGGTNQQTGLQQTGWAPTALGIGQAILGGIQGNKAMKLAEDQFKESKRQFQLNFDAQRKTINTELEDRQRARVASNPGAYEAVDSYVNRNKV